MPTAEPTRESAEFESDLLAKLTKRWGKRVAVKQDELDLDGHFDPGLPDFPAQMVPVLGLPGQPELDPAARQKLLSAAWIAYNEKTGAIENEIILPACRLMLEEHVPVRRDDAATAALHQTIIDEHYHILMCHNAVGVARRRRDLEGLCFVPAQWAVVRGLDRFCADLTGFALDLARIAFAVAAETTINLLFTTIATSFEIQPMNRLTVDMHKRDESGHSVVFRALAGPLYRRLARDERELFQEALLQGLLDFRAPDPDPWAAVAAAGGMQISVEQLAADPARRPLPRETGALQALLADLNLAERLGPALNLAAGT